MIQDFEEYMNSLGKPLEEESTNNDFHTMKVTLMKVIANKNNSDHTKALAKVALENVKRIEKGEDA